MENKYKVGLEVEKEHRTTYIWLAMFLKKYRRMPSENEFFMHIVQDHLAEDTDYYVKLKKLGL